MGHWWILMIGRPIWAGGWVSRSADAAHTRLNAANLTGHHFRPNTLCCSSTLLVNGQTNGGCTPVHPTVPVTASSPTTQQNAQRMYGRKININWNSSQAWSSSWQETVVCTCVHCGILLQKPRPSDAYTCFFYSNPFNLAGCAKLLQAMRQACQLDWLHVKTQNQQAPLYPLLTVKRKDPVRHY